MLDGITPKKKVTLDPPKFDQENGVLPPSPSFSHVTFHVIAPIQFLTAFRELFRAAVTTVRAPHSLSLLTLTLSLSLFCSRLHQKDNNLYSDKERVFLQKL